MELPLGRLIEFLISPVRSVIENVREVPCYRAGFVAGVGGALVVGWISRKLLYWWSRVLQFFAPSLTAATDFGPSPKDRLMEALRSFAVLIIAVVLLALIAKLASAGTG